MRKALLIPFLILTSCGGSTSADDEVDNPVEIEGWRLEWSDEFDQPGQPDPQKWSYDVGGHGWGNNELQYYTDGAAMNARVADGSLIIEAHKEAFEGSEYTSARLVTKGKGDWTYGRIEVRAKLPSGRGTWPAIWMLASQNVYGDGFWPDNGEIDIMEHVGYNPDIVHSTMHTLAYNHKIGTQKGASVRVQTARSDFNVYRIEWTENAIVAYVNNIRYFTFVNERKTNPDANFEEWPFDMPFHLLLNIAVGGDWGGVEGVDDSIFPQRMEVDYVRVYSKVDP